MEKPKILIVDDEKDVRMVLSEFLTKNIECSTLEAGDGREALKILDKGVFDLVLLDIKMPGVSGIDVLKKIKETHPQTDIIMLTAWDSQSVASQTLKEGAIDYITKPSPLNVIFDKVSEILKKRNKYIPKNTKRD